MAEEAPGIAAIPLSRVSPPRRVRRQSLARKLGLSTWSQATEKLEDVILPALTVECNPVEIADLLRDYCAKKIAGQAQ